MIKAILSFVMKNPYVVLGMALALAVAVGGIYAKGYLDGKDAAGNKAVAVAVDVKGKQDEVRNRRPDVPAVTVSLREHRL